MFPGFLTLLLTQPFFPVILATFLTLFRKGRRRKYTGHEVLLNRVSNLQPPGHDDKLTTEPLWRDTRVLEYNTVSLYKKKKKKEFNAVSLYRKKKSSGSSASSAISALILKFNRFTYMYISCMSVLRSGKRRLRAFHSFIKTCSGKRGLPAFPSFIIM